MEWGYRRIRQLLRRLRTPGAIDHDDVGRALVRATGAASVREAVLVVAQRALREFPPIYWTIVRRVDVEGEISDDVAAAVHLSPRSFFRYRAAAIAAIAREVEAATRSASARAAEDLDVLALVARGRYLWKHRTTASLQRARRYYERALEIDPGFARAYAGIADVHLLLGEYLVGDPIEAFHEAHLAVERAMQLDPTLPELHATLADLYLFGQKDLRRSKESFEHALALDPTYVTAHQFAAWHALIVDDVPAALRHLRTGLSVVPDALELHTTLGITHVVQGNMDAGVGLITDVLDLDPDFSFGRYELARALVGAERYDEALDHLDVLNVNEPRDSFAALAAYAAARRGDQRPARRFLARANGRTPQHYLRAYARFGLGERGEALAELGAAARDNEPWIALLSLDGAFAELRPEPAFRAVAGFR